MVPGCCTNSHAEAVGTCVGSIIPARLCGARSTALGILGVSHFQVNGIKFHCLTPSGLSHALRIGFVKESYVRVPTCSQGPSKTLPTTSLLWAHSGLSNSSGTQSYPITSGKLPHWPAAPCKAISPRRTGAVFRCHQQLLTRADDTRC